MQILVVAATVMEIGPFLEENAAADFLITGVGVPLTIYHLTKRLQQISYDLVIQAGIAGSFDQSLNLGEVVLVRQDNFADIGIAEQNDFYTVFEKGFADENEYPFQKGWLVNPDTGRTNKLFKNVNAVTVNTVSDNAAQKKILVSKFNPETESMEGAALHYVCLQERMSFLQLRSISNYVGERDKAKWKLKEAVTNLNIALKHIINSVQQADL